VTVRGGRVTIKPSIFYISKDGETPYTVFHVGISTNFPEDVDETMEIVRKRLLEAQCKIDLDINPEGLRE